MNTRRADTFLKNRLLNNGILFEYYNIKDNEKIGNPIKQEVVRILDGFFQKINIYIKQLERNQNKLVSRVIGNYEIEYRDHIEPTIKIVRITHKYTNLLWIIHIENKKLINITFNGPIDEINTIVDVILNN